jgi:2-keto-3-deoxy-L-rhamnonate aldolase RhmA
MNGQQLREALHSDKRVYGVAVLSPSARWPATLKGLPIDFVFIDTEHIPLNRETVAWMCQTFAALDLAPLVRVPEPNPTLAMMAIDGGAHGVIFPYVERVEEVRDLVGAVKYRPLKGRLLKDLIERGQAPSPQCREYLARHNANAVTIINIESKPAIQALPELLAVEGLDAVLLGPHDLSVNLGKPEDYADAAFNAAVRTIVESARKRRIGAGCHFFWHELDREIDWVRMGVNMLVHSTDLRSAAHGMQTDLDQIRAAVGDTTSSDVKEVIV